jgi:hypothetical protein
MGDLTVQTTWICGSNVFWHAQIGKQRVWFGAQYSGARRGQVGWSCSCSPGKLNPDCAHVAAARPRRCGWNEELAAGAQPEEYRQIQDDGTSTIGRRCPRCGGDVQAIEVGV